MKNNRVTANFWHRLVVLFIAYFTLTFVVSSVGFSQAQTNWPHTTPSADGTTISYEVYGGGDLALIFVHGWSCDSRYWKQQVAPFSENYKVVLIDLAGHGHSGSTRQAYSMDAFGEDVRAVLEATNVQQAVLIGHSMGGMVIAHAASLMPTKVVGLIGVDTYSNVAYPLTEAEFEGMIQPLRTDFQSGTRAFVDQMFHPHSDSLLRHWIKEDMSAGSSVVGLSAMEEYMTGYIEGQHARLFGQLDLPVITVNGDLWPVDEAMNRKHIKDFEAVIVKDGDHFLMMNHAAPFNKALAKAVSTIEEK